MSIFNKQVTVSYTAEQMYALVNDINAYATQFDFEFANKLLGNALNGLFAQLCDSMIDAFRHEAEFRYDHTVSPAKMEHIYR